MQKEVVVDEEYLKKMARIERERRAVRSLRDRLARSFLKTHPELKSNPDAPINDIIPAGTSEDAIRTTARFYKRQAQVRIFLKKYKDGEIQFSEPIRKIRKSRG